jgi:hypothetical protein
MTERVVRERELNRAVLARQLLLERVRLPPPRVLERMAGLQDQYAPSGYLGLWSRVEGLELDDLTRALERRTVVQATLMRGTIHLTSARDFWLLSAGIREGRRAWWLRVNPSVDVEAVTAAAARVRSLLADGPRTKKEIIDGLGGDRATWSGVGGWVDLVRVPPSGTWDQRRADLFGLAETWLAPMEVSKEDGLVHVVRRYLAGFGPATPGDIANWAGLSINEVRPAFARLRLRRFRDERGAELLDLPGQPLPDADVPAPVRLLPTWDATLLVHARRTQILPEPLRARVFNTKTPHSVSTFLVDGRVAGSWSLDRGRVALHPFGRLRREDRRAVEEEGARLEAFLGERAR